MAYSPSTNLTGLRPVANTAGTSPRVNEYSVSASYASPIGEGCLVVVGTVGVRLSGSVTAADNSVLGVAAQNLTSNAGAGAKIKVYDDPQQIYTVVSNTAISAANRLKFQFGWTNMADNTYNATYGYGKTTIALTNVTNTAAANVPLQIMGFPEGPKITVGAKGAPVYVKISARASWTG